MQVSREKMIDFLSEAGEIELKNLYFGNPYPLPPPAFHLYYPPSRIIMPLSGEKHIVFASHGQWNNIIFTSGDVIVTQPYGWTKEIWDMPHRMISIVFHEDYIRVLYIAHNGKPPDQNGPDVYYHTKYPLNQEGKLTLAALLSAEKDHPSARLNFRALLERVRSIRASERRIWQQITDIFAECSIDYNRDSDTAYHFYATIQNKFHYAITSKTAAEIVYNQADHTKENMGLTTWKNAPDGRILKSDTPIAKNYLDEKQIRQLERAVTGYFDYIEDLIERENVFTMEEFSKSVNEFLAFRRYDILKDNGCISHKQAVEKAYQEDLLSIPVSPTISSKFGINTEKPQR